MHIGRRPIAAFGNSDGDLQMLQWTAAGTGPRFCLYVHHTDAEREWAYDRESHIGRLDKGLDEAQAKGWTVVDMKNDWKRIYPFNPRAVSHDEGRETPAVAVPRAALWLASATPARAQTEDILPPPGCRGSSMPSPELVEDSR